MNKRKKFELLKKLFPLLSVVPFIVGAIGYHMAGENISDSLYNSFSLYFVNLNSDSYNIMIEIARWTAALVTTSVILYALKRIGVSIQNNLKCLFRDSIAVHSDSDIQLLSSEKLHGLIYSGRELFANAKSHIIILESDSENLDYYDLYKEKLKNRNVYICLREVELALMKNDISNVTFFDIDGSIARNLWKEIGLWKTFRKNQNITITIYGAGHLGQNILNYGLLLNLFSLEQSIDYNFIGNDNLYQIAHKNLKTGNQDHIHFLPENDGIWKVIEKSDIIIITTEISLEKLQTIGIVCEEGKIYFYAPKSKSIEAHFKQNKLNSFGDNSEVYTDENIRKGKLLKKAIELNYKYKYGHPPISEQDWDIAQKEWMALDGFLKWSNISAADYSEIIREIAEHSYDTKENNIPNKILEELAELEHIRWCRFHYLNNWKYGIPDNNKNKDETKKIHRCLCDYSQLSTEDKKKNLHTISNTLNQTPTIYDSAKNQARK